MVAAAALPPSHRRRLREVWRSAGWPCRDLVEVELLAAGLLERTQDALGREALRVTDAGVAALAATLQRNRAAFDAHETLVARVALEMQRGGRIVWCGLSLRAPLPGPPAEAATEALPGVEAGGAGPDGAGPVRWVTAMPDVYSIRHTTVEAYAEPVVHEIKVRRADLLADLRRPDKGAAYLALASQCWYVLARGIADADEVPADYGVMLADAGGFEVARAAPRRARTVPFPVWMSLARASAMPPAEDSGQGMLGASH
jgi:hypothetical protein